MNNAETIRDLVRKGNKISQKLQELNHWIVNHSYDDPMWSTIVRDRNMLLTDQNVIKYKITQLEMGKPILGDPIGINLPEYKPL